MRLCFIGASKFGYRCLETIMSMREVDVVGIVTTTRTFNISYSRDKPVTNVLYADFKKLADRNQYSPIFVMESGMQDPQLINFVENSAPDSILVIGWYHMIPVAIREIPQKGVAGIHASLLPQYRGGAPLVWAMINGEQETGLTLFYFDEGVDTGDIICQRRVPIRLNDTISTLYERVEEEGLSLIKEMLPRIAVGKAPRIPQVRTEGEVWPQRRPEDGRINWSSPSLSVYNFIRAQTKPYPGAFTFHRGEKLKIWEAKFYDFIESKHEPGEVLYIIEDGLARGFVVATKEDDMPLIVTRVGTDKTDVINGYEYAKKEDLKAGEILGKR